MLPVLTVVLAVLVGVSLGLLGGGGSVLTVPLLVYVAQQGPQEAIATSLLVVAATSALGAVSHARAGRVEWRTALVFGSAGMVGAYAGGRVGSLLPGTLLLVLFSVLLVVTAVAMLRGGRAVDAGAQGHARVWRVLLHGVVVGFITGVVGAGGGFLVVPALVLLGGLPMHTAVGTSLVVIAMKSGAGFLGYASQTPIDWPLAVAVVVAASLGAVVAGRLSDRIDADRLRAAFGWFVLAVGQAVLVTEVPAPARPWTLAGAVVLTAGVIAYVRRSASEARDTSPVAVLDDAHPGSGTSTTTVPRILDPDSDPDPTTTTRSIERSSL